MCGFFSSFRDFSWKQLHALSGNKVDGSSENEQNSKVKPVKPTQ